MVFEGLVNFVATENLGNFGLIYFLFSLFDIFVGYAKTWRFFVCFGVSRMLWEIWDILKVLKIWKILKVR